MTMYNFLLFAEIAPGEQILSVLCTQTYAHMGTVGEIC